MNKDNNWKREFLERLRRFAVSIIGLANKLPKTTAGFVVAKQIIKSGTGANSQEAQDASSLADFINKLSIALREAKETFYWLQIIIESELLLQKDVDPKLKECNEIISILLSSIKSAKKKL